MASLHVLLAKQGTGVLAITQRNYRFTDAVTYKTPVPVSRTLNTTSHPTPSQLNPKNHDRRL